jgi:hypothetical protein
MALCFLHVFESIRQWRKISHLRGLAIGPFVSAFKRPSHKTHCMVVMMEYSGGILKRFYSSVSRQSRPHQHAIEQFIRLERGNFDSVECSAYINLRSRYRVL